MTIDNRLASSNMTLQLIELNRLLEERQQQMQALQRENNQLKRANSGLRNRLQLLLRSTWGVMRARKSMS